MSGFLAYFGSLLTVAAAISPVILSGYFARRAAVRAGYYR